MNCRFLVDEFNRESKATGCSIYVAMLDAKSAFDVVCKEILMRKVHNSGISLNSWALIQSNFSGSNTNGSFTMAISNSLMGPCQTFHGCRFRII